MSNKGLPLHDLSYQEFENLCYDILKKDGKYKNVQKNSNHHCFDFKATKVDSDGDIDNVAIESRHWLHFSFSMYEKMINLISKSGGNIKHFILITSAKLNDKQREKIDNYNKTVHNLCIEVIDYDGIKELVDNNKSVGAKYFYEIRRKRNIKTGLAIVALVLTISSILIIYNIQKGNKYEDSNLNLKQKIQSVNQSIDQLENLEDDLKTIEKEMAKVQLENLVIRKEYEEAMQMKKITEEQLSIIKYAMNKKSLLDIVKDNVPGFLFGIAASIIASIIYGKINTIMRFKKNKDD